MFSISEKNPANLTLISQQNVSGQFPTSLTTYSDVLCAVTSVGNVSLTCFRFDNKGLHLLPKWTRNSTGVTTNTSTAPGSQSPSQISFFPDGRGLLIEVKGVSNVGAIIYPISWYGELAANPILVPPYKPLGPAGYGFQFVNPNTVITTDAAQGVLLYQIRNNDSIYNVSGSYSANNPNNTKAYCWLVWSAYTNNYYAIAAGTLNITQYAVTWDNKLKLVNSTTAPSSLGLKSLTDGVVLSEWGWCYNWLYVLSSGGITVWKIRDGGVDYQSITSSPAGSGSSIGGIAAYPSLWAEN